MQWLRSPIVLWLTLALMGSMLSACSSGIDNIESYKEATKAFPNALKTSDRATKEAQMCGDPMALRDAFVKLVPAVKGLQGAYGALEISNPEIAAIHADLADAVDAHVDIILGMEPTIMTMKLTKSKPMIIDSKAALQEAVDAWNEAVDGFGQ